MEKILDEATWALSTEWQPGDRLYEAFGDAISYLDHLVEPFEEIIKTVQNDLAKYHNEFAAELTADIVSTQRLVLEPGKDGVQISVLHDDGKFGCPAEYFPTTRKSLSEMVEEWADSVTPKERNLLAAHFFKLAGELTRGNHDDDDERLS